MRPSAREAGLGTRFGKWAGALIVAIASLGALPTAAHADPTGSIQWDQQRAQATTTLGAAANSGGYSWTAPAVRFYAKTLNSYCIYSGGGGCVQLTFVCDPSVPAGDAYATYRGDDPTAVIPPNMTGRIVVFGSDPIDNAYAAFISGSSRYCAGPSVAVAAVQRPPTMEQIWREASVAGTGATVELRPSGHGLTGLDTPLWMTREPTTAQDIDASFGAWSVRAHVYLVRVDWRVADAATDTVVASEGSAPASGAPDAYGSPASPLAFFRFRTKGTYRVSGTAVWAATGTITGPFGFSRALEFPEAGLSTSYDYPVSELVGILDR
jgi:hypothetical protein